MTAKVTIINDQKDYEIVHIKNDNSCIILYAYKNMTVILNGNKKEPYIISTLSRDVIDRCIKETNYAESVLGMINNIDGLRLSSIAELYVPSVNVLKTVEMRTPQDTNIYYTGKRVELDNKTNSYIFKFPNNTISISLDAITKLLRLKQMMYCNCNNLLHLSIDDNNISIICRYIDRGLEYKDDYKYIIKLDDINIDNFNLHTFINTTAKKISDTFIECAYFYIKIIDHEDAYAFISLSLRDAYDLFNGIKTRVKGLVEIIGLDRKYDHRYNINCIVKYNRTYSRFIGIEILLDGFNPLIYNIPCDNDLGVLFKEAIFGELEV